MSVAIKREILIVHMYTEYGEYYSKVLDYITKPARILP
jgi:hypothetical protein